jgi:hypothetical protein
MGTHSQQGRDSQLTDIKVRIDQKIIHRKVSGVLHTDRYIELVRELLMAAELHRGYDILVDLRDTVTAPEMIDLMAIVSTWSRLGAGFTNRIAVIIPKVQERARFAQIFKTCMDAQGFNFNQFFDWESATEWLSKPLTIKPIPDLKRSA